MRPSRFRALTVAALALLIPSPALGQVTVYNNFGPGHEGWDYDWGRGWTVAGESVPAQYGVVRAGAAALVEGESYWLWAVGGSTTWCGWCLNLDPALTCPHTLRREGQLLGRR